MLVVVVVSGFVLLGLIACSSDESKPGTVASAAGSCDLLASRCHGIKTALATECHELGHDGDDAKCAPKKDACLAECPEGAGGHEEHDAGTTPASEAGADAMPDAPTTPDPACAEYCTCMNASCSGAFADEGACLSACAKFTSAERDCWTYFCKAAGDAGPSSHKCEHASGGHGLDECP